MFPCCCCRKKKKKQVLKTYLPPAVPVVTEVSAKKTVGVEIEIQTDDFYTTIENPESSTPVAEVEEETVQTRDKGEDHWGVIIKELAKKQSVRKSNYDHNLLQRLESVGRIGPTPTIYEAGELLEADEDNESSATNESTLATLTSLQESQGVQSGCENSNPAPEKQTLVSVNLQDSKITDRNSIENCSLDDLVIEEIHNKKTLRGADYNETGEITEVVDSEINKHAGSSDPMVPLSVVGSDPTSETELVIETSFTATEDKASEDKTGGTVQPDCTDVKDDTEVCSNLGGFDRKLGKVTPEPTETEVNSVERDNPERPLSDAKSSEEHKREATSDESVIIKQTAFSNLENSAHTKAEIEEDPLLYSKASHPATETSSDTTGERELNPSLEVDEKTALSSVTSDDTGEKISIDHLDSSRAPETVAADKSEIEVVPVNTCTDKLDHSKESLLAQTTSTETADKLSVAGSSETLTSISQGSARSDISEAFDSGRGSIDVDEIPVAPLRRKKLNVGNYKS